MMIKAFMRVMLFHLVFKHVGPEYLMNKLRRLDEQDASGSKAVDKTESLKMEHFNGQKNVEMR